MKKLLIYPILFLTSATFANDVLTTSDLQGQVIALSEPLDYTPYQQAETGPFATGLKYNQFQKTRTPKSSELCDFDPILENSAITYANISFPVGSLFTIEEVHPDIYSTTQNNISLTIKLRSQVNTKIQVIFRCRKTDHSTNNPSISIDEVLNSKLFELQ